MRPAIALLILVLAGCIGAAPTTSTTTDARAFLTSQMRLATAPDAQESGVPAGSFFASWAEGNDYPTWRQAPLDHGRILQNVTLHVKLRVTGPVAKTFRFPDVLAYAGSGDAWMGLGNASTPPVLTPGTTYAFDVALAMPTGGLWVPAGEPFGLKLVAVMHQNDAANVEFLVGGDEPSAIAWRESSADATVPTTILGRETAQVEGSAYAGAATPPTASHAKVVTIENARTLLVWMNVTDAQGIPDVDLGVTGPGTAPLAYAGTPTPREMIRLGPANLGGKTGDYTLTVTDYGSAAATFMLEWRAG